MAYPSYSFPDLPKKFSYTELSQATNDFKGLKLGEGGFGAVYRGRLSNRTGQMDIAVKKMKSGSNQGMKEFISEINSISRLRHRNLVKLVGWCRHRDFREKLLNIVCCRNYHREELLLVYEFMPNQSLDKYLFGDLPPLNWQVRYEIARGLASALQYLHEGWEECVVHRDVKASNVMLDSDYKARLGDFGLARFIDHGQSMKDTAVAGTIGYLAPEVILGEGKASRESDVYSFGIVALEIATGRKRILDHYYSSSSETSEVIGLVEWVWGLYEKKTVLGAVDERLKTEFDKVEAERLLKVGLWCCQRRARLRPEIGMVLAMLKFEAPLPNLPDKSPVHIYTPNYQLRFPSLDSTLPQISSNPGSSEETSYFSIFYTPFTSAQTSRDVDDVFTGVH